jgi:hypothetical protein
VATVRVYHSPTGDPCTRPVGDGVCGHPAKRHRVDHIPQGEPCAKCGLDIGAHYKKRQPFASEKAYYVGIDGEGQGREDHRYVLLAWSNESGTRQAWVEAEEGKALTTVQCLEFILKLPRAARAFAFAFNYDLTKILQDVDNEVLWYLFRADKRQRGPGYEKYGPRPVHWGNYKLNIHGSKFTVENKTTGVKRAVWDVFKFYQSKFTTALEDWYKPTPDWATAKDDVERIRTMKDKRNQFDKEDRGGVRAYCFLECRYMAGLTRKLVEAHESAKLHLRSFHGAGSTAGAVLKLMGIDKTSKGINYTGELLTPEAWRYKRNGPPEMKLAIAQAFFGGRFEHSVIGAVRGFPLTAEQIKRYEASDPHYHDHGRKVVGAPGPLWGLDISSAYPYQLFSLPCLECGTWRLTRDRKEVASARTALVRYSLDPGKCPPNLKWGPFPFREKTGAITFPATSGGGWVWREEFNEGRRLFPHVRFHEAWIYECDCDHQPFSEIPLLYVERLRIGKEGPGIVIKLGCNACYGKLAQSIGSNPPFQSWIWAGMITSGTRAQLLQLYSLHRDPANALAMATDGLYTREELTGPPPRPTMTEALWETYAGRLRAKYPEHEAASELARARKLFGEKPLGGWERKRVDAGMFFARPGIYFPLNPSADDIKAMRARGIGRGALHASWAKCIDAYETGNRLHRTHCRHYKAPTFANDCDCPLGVSISHVDRFHGAKSSISRASLDDGAIRELFERNDFGCNPLTGKPRKAPHPFVYTRGPLLNSDGQPELETLTRKGKTRYGQWSQRQIDMTFNPMPKRGSINPDGTLAIRSMPSDQQSAPYNKATHSRSEDALALQRYLEEMMEQPGGADWADYEREMIDV